MWSYFKFLKWKKISYRSYIQMHLKLGISAKQVHLELKKIDENLSIKKSMKRHFKSG